MIARNRQGLGYILGTNATHHHHQFGRYMPSIHSYLATIYEATSAKFGHGQTSLQERQSHGAGIVFLLTIEKKDRKEHLYLTCIDLHVSAQRCAIPRRGTKLAPHFQHTYKTFDLGTSMGQRDGNQIHLQVLLVRPLLRAEMKLCTHSCWNKKK